MEDQPRQQRLLDKIQKSLDTTKNIMGIIVDYYKEAAIKEQDRLKELEDDMDRIPLLQEGVEVYRDFQENAEAKQTALQTRLEKHRQNKMRKLTSRPNTETRTIPTPKVQTKPRAGSNLEKGKQDKESASGKNAPKGTQSLAQKKNKQGSGHWP